MHDDGPGDSPGRDRASNHSPPVTCLREEAAALVPASSAIGFGAKGSPWGWVLQVDEIGPPPVVLRALAAHAGQAGGSSGGFARTAAATPRPALRATPAAVALAAKH